MMMKNLIFDLDNTLCDCSPYYVEAKQVFITYQQERTGIKPEIIDSIVSHIDAQCTNFDHGFNRSRYPRSFEATSLALDAILGKDLDIDAAQHSFYIADQVFSQPYPLYDGIWAMLMNYKSNPNINLFLYTLGDFGVQSDKIHKNNLKDIFPAEHIYIVEKKHGDALQQIIDDHALDKSVTFMIGDSLKGDIGSANRVGIHSIWVKHNASLTWGYENEAHTPTYTIEETVDLPAIISFKR